MKLTTKKIQSPILSEILIPVDLTTETMSQRHEAFLSKMQENKLDAVVIYADREHGANFEYFTGFVPRFEEACLVIHQSGENYLLLGNENTKMGQHSRIKATVIHVPFFSLPNQPMEDDQKLSAYFAAAQLENKNIGVIGWKMFSSQVENNRQLFDLPQFIFQGLLAVVNKAENFADLLLAPTAGLRTVNNANEIAHYEFGAALAGKCLLETLNQVALEKTELEIATSLSAFGQQHNVTTICASGQRFTNATLYPRNKKVQLGETFSVTTSYKGGLSSRAAYVASEKNQLPQEAQGYQEKVVYPYYQAVVTWLENIKLGMTGAEMYQLIEEVLPQKDYHWELNPGHFVADEEWLSSPFSATSETQLKSGMLLQIDIIPKVPGFAGVGCEDGICLADDALQETLKKNYPETWARFEKRKTYLMNQLNINLPKEVLPMSDTVAYYRPFLLDQTTAVVKD